MVPFGKYLHRLGRKRTPVCHPCMYCHEDTAQHTLEGYSVWTQQRCALVATLGAGDLSLPAVE